MYGIPQSGLTPIVGYVEHAPGLPSHDDDAEAVAVVTCHCRDVPSDDLLEELRAEGWNVHDFRDMVQRRRGGRTF